MVDLVAFLIVALQKVRLPLEDQSLRPLKQLIIVEEFLVAVLVVVDLVIPVVDLVVDPFREEVEEVEVVELVHPELTKLRVDY